MYIDRMLEGLSRLKTETTERGIQGFPILEVTLQLKPEGGSAILAIIERHDGLPPVAVATFKNTYDLTQVLTGKEKIIWYLASS